MIILSSNYHHTQKYIILNLISKLKFIRDIVEPFLYLKPNEKVTNQNQRFCVIKQFGKYLFLIILFYPFHHSLFHVIFDDFPTYDFHHSLNIDQLNHISDCDYINLICFIINSRSSFCYLYIYIISYIFIWN